MTDIETIIKTLGELKAKATQGPIDVWEMNDNGDICYRLRSMAHRNLAHVHGTRADADLFAYTRNNIRAILTAYEEQKKRADEAVAWQDEIRSAIEWSGMGIMRTSEGPAGTRICYRPEVSDAHDKRTLEVIHANVDLGIQVRDLTAQLDVAKTDSERLSWLIKEAFISSAGREGICLVIPPNIKTIDARSVIDAYMNSPESPDSSLAALTSTLPSEQP